MNLTERPVFVAFEGLDGTGKTSCARRTAERLGATYMTTPSASVRRYRDALVADLGACQEARQLFYLSTVFAASEAIRALREQGTSVVLDRYFLSTQAYAEFRGSRLRVDDLHALLFPADLTVVLVAPLDVRQARVAARGGSVADAETLNEVADRALRQSHGARLGLPVLGRVLQVDTSTLSPDDVAELVASEVCDLRRAS